MNRLISAVVAVFALGMSASPALGHRHDGAARRSVSATNHSQPGSTLPAGGSLHPGGVLRSPNGRYAAVMERDGNLVVYGPKGLEWQSKTGAPGTTAVVQQDGNVVLRTPGGRVVWSSATAPSRRDRLVIQNDGNLVIYTRDGRPLWSISTGYLGNGTKLSAGWSMTAGQTLRSADGRNRAVMQTDGNFVVYNSTGNATWNSGTDGNPGAHVSMQTDGNLVVYSAQGQALWSSGTNPSQSDTLIMQTDGNLVIYTGDGRPLWSISTGYLGNATKLSAGWSLAAGQALRSADGRFRAVMQTDGNFVVYGPSGQATWNSATEGNPGAHVSMQTDGNLVVYSAQGQALWSSGTNPSQSDTLIMQSDGNLVVYNGSGTALWSIGTGLIKSVFAPWAPNWSYAGGFYDEWDYSDGASDEYGIDVPLNAGTPIYAPEAGHIFWQSEAQAGGWGPGRLVEVLNSGAVVAFGHVLPYGHWPRSVAGGEQIATVGDNGSNSHVEFMYDASGNGGPSYYDRSYFLPASAVSSSNGCPNRSWSGGGAGVDPCAVLINYMRGSTP